MQIGTPLCIKASNDNNDNIKISLNVFGGWGGGGGGGAEENKSIGQ